MPQRIHISQNPIEKLAQQPKYRLQRICMKPRGFWYGVDGEWEEWCRSEMPEWLYPFRYEVDVSKANVLVLDNPHDLKKFNETFRAPMSSFTPEIFYIDWARVVPLFDGIEIAPYDRDFTYRQGNSLGAFWHTSWDAASGCIWNVEKITIKLLETYDVPAL